MSEPHVASVAIFKDTGVKMEQVVLTHRFGDNDAVDISSRGTPSIRASAAPRRSCALQWGSAT